MGVPGCDAGSSELTQQRSAVGEEREFSLSRFSRD